MQTAFIRVLGTALPLALLLFPFVTATHAKGNEAPFSMVKDIILSFSLAMGFCSPLYFYYARFFRNYARRIPQLGPNVAGDNAVIKRELELAEISLRYAARLGLVLGAASIWLFFP